MNPASERCEARSHPTDFTERDGADAEVYAVAIQPLHKTWLEGRGYARRLLHFKLNQTKPNRFHYSYKADFRGSFLSTAKPFLFLPHLHRAFLELVLSPPGPRETAALGPSSSGRRTRC